MSKSQNSNKFAIALILVFLIMICAIAFLVYENYTLKNSVNDDNSTIAEEKQPVQAQETKKVAKSEYALTDNNLSKFDLSFLKFENNKKNMIYSPLSIKYAFKMLEEGTTGNSKSQLSSIVGGYDLTKYNTNENMALANAFFIRDSYKDSVNEKYIDLLKSNYDANVEYDDFNTSKNVNNWVKENTLGLIDELYSDDDVSNMDFALINALGIDMEWNHKFLNYFYEDDKNITSYVNYNHENLYWSVMEELHKLKFEDNQEVSSMRVVATLNNYDIVKELGEDNIKQTVKDAFIKWAKSDELYSVAGDVDEYFNNDFSDEGIEKAFEKYWAEGNYGYENNNIGYLGELKENYGKVEYSTDFSIYVDDDVKVFSKDLKEYDGTTLQYIGIMPINESLDKFVENTSEADIKELEGKLKDLKLNNFKDGVVTKITGYIPKFKFDYELSLQEDLEKLGVTDVFQEGKANLTELTSQDNAFINNVKHKANIEFTEDGIKAAAATGAGGMGAGEFFDYIFDVPVEKIDITFDKPYMFIIKDKKTGETWFVGTVYEPLDSKDEAGSISEIYDFED